MEVAREVDAARFLRETGPWLERAEPENNHILGLASARDPGRVFWTVRDGERIAGAAARRGERPLGITRMEDEALEGLVDHLRRAGVRLGGVVGPRPDVDRFVRIWGQPHEMRMDQQVYVRTSPIGPRPDAPGRFEVVEEDDVAEIEPLMRAFCQEAGIGEAGPSVEGLLAEQARAGELFAWRDDATIVSFAALSGATARGVRIDALYTRPALRQRGYARSLIRALTDRMLSDGRDYCVVYADRRSASANALYRGLGFTAAFESRLYRFARAEPEDACD